jgi:hypothetical protein
MVKIGFVSGSPETNGLPMLQVLISNLIFKSSECIHRNVTLTVLLALIILIDIYYREDRVPFNSSNC